MDLFVVYKLPGLAAPTISWSPFVVCDLLYRMLVFFISLYSSLLVPLMMLAGVTISITESWNSNALKLSSYLLQFHD